MDNKIKEGVRHTPGPYLLVDDETPFIYALNGDGTTRFHCSIQPGYVRNYARRVEQTSEKEIMAVARLFAAAPDMLQALETIEMFGKMDGSEFALSAAKTATAAIARATGKEGV